MPVPIILRDQHRSGGIQGFGERLQKMSPLPRIDRAFIDQADEIADLIFGSHKITAKTILHLSPVRVTAAHVPSFTIQNVTVNRKTSNLFFWRNN